METSGNAVEKFLNVKMAVPADNTTKTIQKVPPAQPGLRSIVGFYRDFCPFLTVYIGDASKSQAYFSRDSMLMIGVGSGRKMPAALHVYVKNADETYRRALEAGATALHEMIEDHGDRFGAVQDAAGNQWYIATHLGARYIPDQLHTVSTYFHPTGADRFIDFVKRAFSAEEVARYDSPEGEVLHAKVRIGESVIEVGEAHGPWQNMPTMINMYVPDCDALYERALRAGTKSISPVADQPYGVRSGAVEDVWGNQWYIATPIR